MASIIQHTLEALHLKDGVVPPNDKEFEELQQQYAEAGQEQVFAFYEKLSNAEKRALFNQALDFTPARVSELAMKALKDNSPEDFKDEVKAAKIEPIPNSSSLSTLDSSEEDIEKWYKKGLELIGENKVAVVLMAGGQGTRLGSSDPKGCYDIGLPSKKSLFQLQAERIYRVQVLAAASKKTSEFDVIIPWYIMTSGPTRRPTEEFFEKNNYFGLNKNNVCI